MTDWTVKAKEEQPERCPKCRSTYGFAWTSKRKGTRELECCNCGAFIRLEWAEAGQPTTAIPPDVAQRIYYALEQQTMTFSEADMFHLCRAAGVAVPPNVERHAEFHGWAEDAATPTVEED